jgi:hypothetical protein
MRGKQREKERVLAAGAVKKITAIGTRPIRLESGSAGRYRRLAQLAVEVTWHCWHGLVQCIGSILG